MGQSGGYPWGDSGTRSRRPVMRAGTCTLAAFLSACTAGAVSGNAGPAERLDYAEAVLEYVDSAHAPVPQRIWPASTALFFPFAAGTLHGSGDGDSVFAVQLTDTAAVLLEVGSRGEVIDRAAAEMSRGAASGGLRVAPAGTRFGSFGVFAFDPATGRPFGPAAFVDSNRNTLMLAYFDRPCEVTGTTVADANRYEYRVTIPERGAYWLRIVAVADEQYRVFARAHRGPVRLNVQLFRAASGSEGEFQMLELRPGCEHCDRDLPPESADARICSFECTFCAACVEEILQNVCPNCGGGFVPRPIRPVGNYRDGNDLSTCPATRRRVHKPVDPETHGVFAAVIKDIPPERR